MKATWEKIENNQVVLRVEVDETKVAEALDKAFKKVSAKVVVPGFRKGKVPRVIFEKRFGVESLYQDALDILLPEAYIQAIQENDITPVDRPSVDVEQFGKGQPLIFKATVTVKPEVKLGEYKGVPIANAAVEVTDEELDAELKRLQERHAELTVVEDGAVENGDFAIIDFEGFVDGEAFEGGKAENYQLEIGSGSFIPGFEEQIVGMKKGEEKDIEVTFPEEYHAENLKGKAAVFKVKVNEIKRKNLPALDDEFAKDVSEFDTLDEYKEDLKQKLLARKQKEDERRKENEIVKLVAEASEVDVPEVMIDNEVELMVNEFEQRLRAQGMSLDLYYQFSGQNEQQLKEQMRPDASVRVRNNLVLEAVAKAEGIEATEEDVNAELSKLSEQFKRPVEEIRSIFASNGTLDKLTYDIVTRKTIDFLLAHSKSA
ncbi:trigger factor [Paenibacillus thermoaerophilus]|uniref:Trigger factor n=1 Tax=Paenibacillus thermoaerophilus TaxID=1215385 RepID=A0ABW2V6Q7_9BACL|nr:trigger factor [Paenibacillus thermoaerophilus]TMV11078.1 trigger factor [Paenibacillus thermoaerophilus]